MNLKKIFCLLFVAVCALFVASCTNHTVTISESSLELIVGDTHKLSATVDPSDAEIKWSSSDDAIVTVTNGNVVAKAVGSAVVKAYVSEKEFAECNVTVKKRDIQPTLVLGKNTLSLKLNDEFTLTATCMAGTEVASGAEISFSSSDATIVSVDATGKLKANGEGSAVITVTALWDGKSVSATATVSVTIDAEIQVDKEAVELSLLELNNNDKKEHQIEASVLFGGEEVVETITYTSENENVAVVDATGKIQAVGVGSAVIHLEASHGGKDLTKDVEVSVVKTTQTTFTVSAAPYASTMVTKEVKGYYNAQVLTLNVEPYAEGLEIEWTIEGSGAELNILDAANAIKVVVDSQSKGSSFKVTAVLEGNADYTVNYEIKSYIPVSKESDLWAMNDLVDANNSLAGDFLLTNDIVCQNNDPANSDENGYICAVIGRKSGGNDTVTFNGLFDGNGYTISNLKFSNGGKAYNGLFGKVVNGTIQNLAVECVSMGNNGLSGAICGWLQCFGGKAGLIQNCYVKANVPLKCAAAATWVNGAIAGRQEGYNQSIENCYVEITPVEGNGAATGEGIGGIAGRVWYHNYKNVFVNVTDNNLASKVGFYGRSESTNAITGYGADLCKMAKGDAALITAGFTAESLTGAMWNVAINEGVISVGLVPGCTYCPEVYLEKGEDAEVQVTKTVQMSVTTNSKNVVWESSDEEVATVDANGLVTGVKEGTAVITAKVGELSVSMNVEVKPAPVMVIVAADELALNYYNLSTEDVLEATIGPKFTVEGEEAVAQFAYAIADNTVASVDANGKVTALKIGTTKLTITATYEGKEYTKEVAITVTASHVTALTFTAEPYTSVMVDRAVRGYVDTQDVKVNVAPWDDKLKVTWTSSYSAMVATVNANDSRIVNLNGKDKNNGTSVKITGKVEGFTGEIVINVHLYYAITCESDLWDMNSHNYSGTFIAGDWLLCNDIVCQNNDPANSDANGYICAVVGRKDGANDKVSFNGLFDGNGYKISNLKFANSSKIYNGLFGKVGTGTIQNLTVECVSLGVNGLSGAICGWLANNANTAAVIKNCHVIANVSLKVPTAATFCNGAIVGRQELWNQQIQNCYVEVTGVEGTGAFTSTGIGGIVGRCWYHNYKNVFVNVTNNTYAANVGLFGKSESTNTVAGCGADTCKIAVGDAALITAGFTAESLTGAMWNVAINEGVISVALVPGCTYAPEVYLEKGEDAEVQATKTVQMSVTTNSRNVVWESSDEEVATVDANGLVTGVKEGTAVITAKVGTLSVSMNITVKPAPVMVVVADDELALNYYNLSTDDVLEATMAPKFTVDGKEETAQYAFAVADATVASVDANGKVTALKIGTTKLTITATYEGKEYTKEVAITVTASHVTALTFTAEPYTSVMVDRAVRGYVDTQDVKVNVSPWDDKLKVTWTSSYSAMVATVNANDSRIVNLNGKDKNNGTSVKITGKVEGFTGEIVINVHLYYAITCEADLWDMNSHNYSGTFIAGDWLLCNDIVCQNNDPANSDANGYICAVVGRKDGANDKVSFNGLFDGNGYKISNLKFANSSKIYNGLFGKVGTGTIQNLTVECVSLGVNGLSGAICGWLANKESPAAVIKNCHVIANVSLKVPTAATFCNGAIVGRQELWNQQIQNCYVEITGVEGTGAFTSTGIGGIVGRSWYHNYKNVFVNVTNNTYAANVGFVGKSESTNTVAGCGADTCKLAVGDAALITAGFTAESLTGAMWNVAINEGVISAELVNGCTYKPATYLDKGEDKEVDQASSVQMSVVTNSKNITWESSDETIATVNAKGVVTGVCGGTATITAKVGELSVSMTVTVIDHREDNDFLHGFVIQENKNGLVFEQSKDAAKDDNSQYGYKLTAAADKTSWPSVLLEVGPIDFTTENKAVTIDVKVVKGHKWFSIKYYDANWDQIGGEEGHDVSALNTWETFTLSCIHNDIHYIRISINAENSADGNEIYFDNLQFADAHAVATALAINQTVKFPQKLSADKNWLISFDMKFTSSAELTGDDLKVRLMIGNWSNSYGYYSLFNQDQILAQTAGVTITKLEDGWFHFVLDTALAKISIGNADKSNDIEFVYRSDKWNTASCLFCNLRAKENIDASDLLYGSAYEWSGTPSVVSYSSSTAAAKDENSTIGWVYKSTAESGWPTTQIKFAKTLDFSDANSEVYIDVKCVSGYKWLSFTFYDTSWAAIGSAQGVDLAEGWNTVKINCNASNVLLVAICYNADNSTGDVEMYFDNLRVVAKAE